MIKKITINNITLKYDDEKTDIDNIKEIIKANNFIFDTLPIKKISIGIKDDSDSTFIQDFDTYFDNTLKLLLQENTILEILEDKNLLSDTFSSLFMKYTSNGIEINDSNITLDDETYFLIACKYYDPIGDFAKLSNSLKTHNDNELFINFLKDTQLFKEYNNWISEVITLIIKNNNIPYFESKKDILNYISNEITSSEKPKANLPFNSKQEFENIFYGFLKFINAPTSWYDNFKNLKFERGNQSNLEESFYDKKSNKISINASGSIDYFIIAVHEFIHSISSNKNAKKSSLEEFPSIFYEKLAALYLINLGIDASLVKNIAGFRSKNNFHNFTKLSHLIFDFYQYKDFGAVTFDNKLQEIKDDDMSLDLLKKITNLQKTNPDKEIDQILKEYEYIPKNIEYYKKKITENIFDNITIFFNEWPHYLEAYLYIINSYIADCLLTDITNEHLNKMIYITNNIHKFTPNSMLEYLNLPSIFSSQKSSHISLTKKK